MKKLTYEHISALQRVETMLEKTAEQYPNAKLAQSLEDDKTRMEEIRRHLHKAITQPVLPFVIPPVETETQ